MSPRSELNPLATITRTGWGEEKRIGEREMCKGDDQGWWDKRGRGKRGVEGGSNGQGLPCWSDQ
eukprot:3941939-Rhodomonas_salina.1